MKHNLVAIPSLIPTAVIDLKYATTDNFTGKVIYQHGQCFLAHDAALALKEAADEFNKKGYLIKIWDAYRPHSAQFILWEIVPDERYVADPAKGSRHNRGCAVDLTLVDFQGNELDMGTGFDDFTEKSHRSYSDLSAVSLQNRRLLQSVMEKHGFVGFEYEWWHFDFQGWEKYPILDIPLDQIT